MFLREQQVFITRVTAVSFEPAPVEVRGVNNLQCVQKSGSTFSHTHITGWRKTKLLSLMKGYSFHYHKQFKYTVAGMLVYKYTCILCILWC